MNLYFLVEGQTEAKIYPKWLNYLLPQFSQVKDFEAVKKQNYYLFNAKGYPSIIKTHLINAIAEVNAHRSYQYLVVCLDADEQSVNAREQEVYQYLQNQNIHLATAQLILIVQNRCIDTWLLGNRKIYKRNPQDKTLFAYTQFYNVARKDPELMGKYKGFTEYQRFHKHYFKLLSRESRLRYSESMPYEVATESYLKQLLLRVEESSHLQTFAGLIAFCNKVNHLITPY